MFIFITLIGSAPILTAIYLSIMCIMHGNTIMNLVGLVMILPLILGFIIYSYYYYLPQNYINRPIAFTRPGYKKYYYFGIIIGLILIAYLLVSFIS